MKKNKFNIFLANLIIAGLIFSLVGAALTQAAAEPLQRKIIVFKSDALNGAVHEALINKFGGVKVKDLNLINSKVVLLTPRAQALLAQQADVLRIDDDVEVFALENIFEPLSVSEVLARFSFLAPSQAGQTLPWGVDRIDAEKVWNISTGEPIKMAIIDTGIDRRHPDLVSNIKGGVSTVWYTSNYNDDNGHGTHVAGIAAAVDNTIGVVGVGPQIDLYAVKVLDRRGSGYLSDIIEGLDWAIQNGMRVVNMSLGTTVNVLSFQEAVQRVNAAGIVQVAAAGNNGKVVHYPAAYDEVIAVSAIGQNNTIASWSSRGPQIDLAAPGVSIYSTYKSQTYKTLSGTSMAAPHVAGTAALVLSVPGKCDINSDGKCSPTEVQQRLEATAEDLGAPGRDNLYGAGLVDAEQAVIR